MRTAVYVDGFNLYYWLKPTPYRWVNLKTLALNAITRPGDEHQIVAVKYFTAHVSDTQDDPGKSVRQDAYLNALRRTIPELTICKGEFRRKQKDVYRVGREGGTGPLVTAWVTEEKGSDVNLAVELLNDAWLNIYDCAVVISNDSDLERAVSLAKKKGRTILNLVRGDAEFASLRRVASHTKFLNEQDLRKALLPRQIPSSTPGRFITIPRIWEDKERHAGINER